MNLFIRTGKVRNYEDNQTQGLITLLPSDLKIQTSAITLSFVGKDSIEHEMHLPINPSSHILNAIKAQHKWSLNKQFLFSYLKNNKVLALKEEDLYSYLSVFDVYIKDIRTYGVNITFVNILWFHLRQLDLKSTKDLTPKELAMKIKVIKKLISQSIEETAIKIGHTKQICKGSYIVTQLIDLLKTAENDISIIEKFVSLDNPIKIFDSL
jgi:DNA topoisomerase IB